MGSYTPQTPCAPRAAKHPLRVCSAPRSLKYPRRKEVPPIDFCHIPVSIIKRSEGRSAVAAAAYRSGTKLTNEWDGLTHDYTRKGGVVHAEIMLPAHAPPEFADRSTLWNSVEQIEKARDSQLAREIEAALPRELSREQQLALVRAYVKDNFVGKGMCADFAIHDKGTGNPHVHITLYPPKESNRDKLCAVIDNILLNEKTASFESFLQKLEQQGYEIKRGKYTSVKGTRQKRFIRFRTLGAGYSEDEIKAVIAGEAEHRPHQKQPPKEQPFHLLVDIQAKLSEGKSEGYARWAKRYNLKEMSKTLIFLQENKIGSIEEMQERVDAATAHYHELGDSIKAAEKRLAEIAVLKAHIINYAKTRPVYDAYRKTGYSKHFLETHRTEITLHKAAKAAFNESNLKTLPKVKELDVEYSKLLTGKKARYPDYRKAKEEMQAFLRAKRNVELFFAEEKSSAEKTKSR